MRRSHRARPAFALLAVLWMLAGGTLLGALVVLTARDAQDVGLNRIALARARWRADGCAERARAAVDDATGDDAIADSLWARLDRAVAASPLVEGCALRLVPAGTTLDVNSADEDQLRTLFVQSGLAPASADSLAAAVFDWRDADDDRRFAGAERAWYDREHRPRPRNANFASVEELRLVKGMDELRDYRLLLGVEPERILLSRAPRAVLATVPGITPRVLDEIEHLHTIGAPTIDIDRIAAGVDSVTRDVLLLHHAELGERTTALPNAWVIMATASEGRPPITAMLELRVVRSGRRLAVMRRRSDS